MALLINNEFVGDDLFIAEFRQLGGLNIGPDQPGAQHEATSLRRLAEERVVGRVLLRQRAAAQGMTVTPAEIDARRQQQWGTSSASVCGAGVVHAIAESLLLEKYCHWITRHEQRASRTEVEAFYRSRRETFRMPEQVKLMQVMRNIYLPEEEAAAWAAMETAEQQLKAGTPFQKVADRFSDCGGRTVLGWVKRGDTVADFEDAAFAIAKGERSSIFHTVFGLHIVHVMERRNAGYQSLDEVRPHLARQLLEMRRERRIHAEVMDAMQAAIIVVAPLAKEEEALHG